MKKRRLVVLCSKETLVRFKRYAAYYKNYEEALNSLLDVAEGMKPIRML